MMTEDILKPSFSPPGPMWSADYPRKFVGPDNMWDWDAGDEADAYYEFLRIMWNGPPSPPLWRRLEGLWLEFRDKGIKGLSWEGVNQKVPAYADRIDAIREERCLGTTWRGYLHMLCTEYPPEYPPEARDLGTWEQPPMPMRRARGEMPQYPRIEVNPPVFAPKKVSHKEARAQLAEQLQLWGERASEYRRRFVEWLGRPVKARPNYGYKLLKRDCYLLHQIAQCPSKHRLPEECYAHVSIDVEDRYPRQGKEEVLSYKHFNRIVDEDLGLTVDFCPRWR